MSIIKIGNEMKRLTSVVDSRKLVLDNPTQSDVQLKKLGRFVKIDKNSKTELKFVSLNWLERIKEWILHLPLFNRTSSDVFTIKTCSDFLAKRVAEIATTSTPTQNSAEKVTSASGLTPKKPSRVPPDTNIPEVVNSFLQEEVQEIGHLFKQYQNSSVEQEKNLLEIALLSRVRAFGMQYSFADELIHRCIHDQLNDSFHENDNVPAEIVKLRNSTKPLTKPLQVFHNELLKKCIDKIIPLLEKFAVASDKDKEKLQKEIDEKARLLFKGPEVVKEVLEKIDKADPKFKEELEKLLPPLHMAADKAEKNGFVQGSTNPETVIPEQECDSFTRIADDLLPFFERKNKEVRTLLDAFSNRKDNVKMYDLCFPITQVIREIDEPLSLIENMFYNREIPAKWTTMRSDLNKAYEDACQAGFKIIEHREFPTIQGFKRVSDDLDYGKWRTMKALPQEQGDSINKDWILQARAKYLAEVKLVEDRLDVEEKALIQATGYSDFLEYAHAREELRRGKADLDKAFKKAEQFGAVFTADELNRVDQNDDYISDVVLNFVKDREMDFTLPGASPKTVTIANVNETDEGLPVQAVALSNQMAKAEPTSFEEIFTPLVSEAVNEILQLIKRYKELPDGADKELMRTDLLSKLAKFSSLHEIVTSVVRPQIRREEIMDLQEKGVPAWKQVIKSLQLPLSDLLAVMMNEELRVILPLLSKFQTTIEEKAKEKLNAEVNEQIQERFLFADVLLEMLDPRKLELREDEVESHRKFIEGVLGVFEKSGKEAEQYGFEFIRRNYKKPIDLNTLKLTIPIFERKSSEMKELFAVYKNRKNDHDLYDLRFQYTKLMGEYSNALNAIETVFSDNQQEIPDEWKAICNDFDKFRVDAIEAGFMSLPDMEFPSIPGLDRILRDIVSETREFNSKIHNEILIGRWQDPEIKNFSLKQRASLLAGHKAVVDRLTFEHKELAKARGRAEIREYKDALAELETWKVSKDTEEELKAQYTVEELAAPGECWEEISDFIAVRTTEFSPLHEKLIEEPYPLACREIDILLNLKYEFRQIESPEESPIKTVFIKHFTELLDKLKTIERSKKDELNSTDDLPMKYIRDNLRSLWYYTNFLRYKFDGDEVTRLIDNL